MKQIGEEYEVSRGRGCLASTLFSCAHLDFGGSDGDDAVVVNYLSCSHDYCLSIELPPVLATLIAMGLAGSRV